MLRLRGEYVGGKCKMVPEKMNKDINSRISVRVKFTKTGSIKYISHLDLSRTVTQSFLRSKLPIWYTEGFNPHPRIAFTPPLSVGVSSLTEFADFKFVEDIDLSTVAEKLNAAFPDGLRALECYLPESHFNDIKWGLYKIEYEVGEQSADIAEKTVALLKNERIVVMKKTKSGALKEMDMTDGVCESAAKYENGTLTLSVKLSCDALSFVNPRYINVFLAEKMPEVFAGVEENTTREEVYLADGVTKFR